MTNFTPHELSIICDAVRYYQVKEVPKDTVLNLKCNQIIDSLYPKITINGVEPAYRLSE